MSPKQSKERKTPDYTIRALDTKTQTAADIGAAFIKENGRIFLWINPFVTLPVGAGVFDLTFPKPRSVTSCVLRRAPPPVPGREVDLAPDASFSPAPDEELPF